MLKLKRPVLTTFLISGFWGALLGLLHAQYQWAIEPSQIVAGLVKYPRYNPFYIISTKTWNIIHQISAVALSLGISERVLSFLISILIGSLAFQALAIFTIALTHNSLLSILMPFFVFYLHGTAFPGPVYPIMILGSDSTYGMMGLSFCILAISLLSLKKYKLGGFLLGLAPSFHATQAFWFNLVILFVFLTNPLNFKKILRRNYLFFLLGYFISLLSLTYHFLNIYDVPKLSPQLLSPYYQAIILHWSDHYHKFSLLNGNGLRIAVSLILSILGLRLFKKNASQSFIFKTFIIAFLLATFFSPIYWFPLDKASLYFNILILFPARLFNYHILGSLLLLVALMWQMKLQLSLSLFISSLVLYRFLYFDLHQPSWLPFSFSGFMGLIIFLFCFIFLFYYACLKKQLFSLKIKELIRIKRKSNHIFLKITYALFILIINLTFVRAFKVWRDNQKNYFQDSTNNSFFQKVSQRKGMIIPGPKITYLMLKTRRPVLFNGGPGILNYAPEGSLEMERIFRQVYGIDFFNPPPEIVEYGKDLPPFKVKPLWENRSLSEWQEIKKEFSTTDIITEADWQLQLPVVTHNNNLILYTIPD